MLQRMGDNISLMEEGGTQSLAVDALLLRYLKRFHGAGDGSLYLAAYLLHRLWGPLFVIPPSSQAFLSCVIIIIIIVIDTGLRRIV